MSDNQEAARAVLARLEEEGRLTVEAVIAEAQDPASPLHDAFEWDVEAAAQRHWEAQARKLIRSFKITVEVRNVVFKAPQWVPDPDVPAAYVSTVKLRSEADRARDVVCAEFARASSALQRAKAVAAVLGIDAEVEGLHERVLSLSDLVAARAEGQA
jgi:hypothetical protein